MFQDEGDQPPASASSPGRGRTNAQRRDGYVDGCGRPISWSTGGSRQRDRGIKK